MELPASFTSLPVRFIPGTPRCRGFWETLVGLKTMPGRMELNYEGVPKFTHTLLEHNGSFPITPKFSIPYYCLKIFLKKILFGLLLSLKHHIHNGTITNNQFSSTVLYSALSLFHQNSEEFSFPIDG